MKQSDLEISYNNYLWAVSIWRWCDATAYTESFLLIRVKAGPGWRVAASKGTTMQSPAPIVEKHLMMMMMVTADWE